MRKKNSTLIMSYCEDIRKSLWIPPHCWRASMHSGHGNSTRRLEISYPKKICKEIRKYYHSQERFCTIVSGTYEKELRKTCKKKIKDLYASPNSSAQCNTASIPVLLWKRENTVSWKNQRIVRTETSRRKRLSPESVWRSRSITGL